MQYLEEQMKIKDCNEKITRAVHRKFIQKERRIQPSCNLATNTFINGSGTIHNFMQRRNYPTVGT